MAQDFDSFLTNLFSVLASDTFYNNESLTAYLDLPITARTGDEANIVDDKIASVLIGTLGYKPGERQYNLKHSGNKRTDFTVLITEYPRPCFVVESKNTTIAKLDKHLPQLADYMRSKGASRGLLINGYKFLTYELTAGKPVGTGEIHLAELVRKWRGESLLAPRGSTGTDALDYDEKVSLQAFWQRFHRDAFSGLTTLIEDLALTKSGAPHALDGSTFPAESRIQIHQPSEPEFIKLLIDESRELIREVQNDVAAQVRLRLAEYSEYKKELDARPTGGLFSTEFKSLSDALIQQLETWGITSLQCSSLRSRLDAQFYGTFERKPFASIKADAGGGVREVAAALTGKHKKTAKQIENSVKSVEDAADEVGALIRSYQAHRKRLAAPYEEALRVHGLYEQWRERVATLLLRTDDPVKLTREFAAQTAYVLFVRMLMVRIVEDKGLMRRMFTNGGVALWFDKVEEQYLSYAEGRSTDYLLEMAYESAQHIYAHYYSEKLVFDWYLPDRNLVVRLLHRLAGFDLSKIDRDVIGHIYSGYVKGEHKHESGMYYTPQKQVEYILDRIDYTGKNVLGKKLLDLSCGSGAFLVEACRRQIDAYRDYFRKAKRSFEDLSGDEIQSILDGIKNSLYGLELNPFACYLAETNLLIQTLDLFKNARHTGSDAHLDSFHIYNTDTLRYEPETLMLLNSSLTFSPEELDAAEQIKSKLGDHENGFDYVVGNPPYVRADEGGEGILQYRDQIKKYHPLAFVRNVMVRKWDLYIPFIALGFNLLQEGTGQLGIITSSAIEKVPYAENLRAALVSNSQLDEVSFFPKQFLFEDAMVENTVFTLTRKAPLKNHEVLRRWHADASGKPAREERLNQTAHGENVFRQNIVSERYADSTLLDRICYISVGMAAHADDRRFPGEFTKDALISEVQDDDHPVLYIEGDHIDPYELSHVRFLEYGAGLRAPERIRRATFPELYDRPKLMRGRTSHAWLDNGTTIDSGWVYANHSVMLFVQWHELVGVNNKSITKALKELEVDRADLEQQSQQFQLPYLLAIFNSPNALEILSGVMSSTRHTEFQPDDFRRLFIPNAGTVEQLEISSCVLQLLGHGEQFLRARRNGWKIDTMKGNIAAPADLSKYPLIQKMPLRIAKVTWDFVIEDPTAHLSTIWRRDLSFRRKHQQVAHFNSPVAEEAIQWLERQFAGAEKDFSFQAAEAAGWMIPATPDVARTAWLQLKGEEENMRNAVEDFNRLRAQVDDLVLSLYQSRVS